jgi:hypothetical protein
MSAKVLLTESSEDEEVGRISSGIVITSANVGSSTWSFERPGLWEGWRISAGLHTLRSSPFQKSPHLWLF